MSTLGSPRLRGGIAQAVTPSDAGGMIVDVHEFDLAYGQLHVPETA